MIVYVFCEEFFRKLFLPVKVFGVYPVYVKDEMLLVNIEGIDGKWYMKPIEGYSVFVNGDETVQPEVTIGSTCVVSNGKRFIYIVTSALYDNNTTLLKPNKKEFSFGSKNNNEICYHNSYITNNEYKITLSNEGYWTIQASTKNVYLNDAMVTSARLYSGDYIFCFGVKVIFFGTCFMIHAPATARIDGSAFSAVALAPATGDVGNVEYLDDTPLYDKKSYFTKAPRVSREDSQDSISIDMAPNLEKGEETPIILTIGPQLTMMCMSILSVVDVFIGFVEGTVDTLKFVTGMGTVVSMIAGVMIWPFILKGFEKKKNKKLEKKRKRKYKEYLEKKKVLIEEKKQNRIQVLLEECPPIEKCQSIIESRNSQLWKKDIDDYDFLKVCLGTGTVNSNIEIIMPEDRFSLEKEDELTTLMKSVAETAKYIDNAPFTYSFANNNITAVLGEKLYADKVLDDIFLQIMTSHSYAYLKIIVFTTPDNEKHWEYLKILPHCWNNQHTVRYFATNVEEFNEFSVEIDSVFEARKSKNEEAEKEDDGRDDSQEDRLYIQYKPYFLIFTDNIEAIRNTTLVKKILNYKQNLGFSILIENDRLSSLPDQTHGFISIQKDVSGIFTNKLKLEDKNEFRVDFSKMINMYYCSQILANVPILLEKGKYELPKTLSFLEMFKVGRVEQLNSLDRWKSNNPTNSLSVPVGVDQNGELFKMDLHEKVYGPHGLVAGTTGSGKSEWIVTLILSLAVNFSPDEVQFVLVDYKGGGLAMSFENKELGIKLPHLAGTITNLDKSAINRSIASIESELKRRQSIFNDAREKLKEGQMDIYKYQQFYRKGMVDIPLSHLLIICDEFAELKQQQPEFMDQLISTSRIGRSLGVHLILATQKPSGVVNDQIWSNSRFKVCLRVQDKGDSNEILKKPDAAYLKQVGAFYLEVGNDEYYNLGQSAWAGAKYYPSDVVKRSVDQSVQSINNIGKVVNYVDDSDETKKIENSQGEELLNIVKYIDELDKQEHFVKQQLWLPNIPETIYLTDIKKKYNFTPKKFDFTTVIGEYDEPRNQEQNILTINPADGNIAIVGQPGSGKELLLSTLIFSNISEHTPQEINYYILDFGAETLRKFAKFPHVGEVVFQDDMERVGGVIQLVMDELNKRKELFQDYNGSLKYYNAHSGKILPVIALVINAFDVFEEILSRVVDSLNALYRDGPRYGIIFILSASSQNTFKPRILQYFNRFIVMNLQDESQYRNLTNCRRGLIPSNLFGRGICKTNDDDDSYCEFQTARITMEDKELEYLKQVAEMLNQHYKIRAKKITTIPDNITSEDLAKYLTTIADLPIGYNFYEKDIAKLDLSQSKIYPVVTKDLKANIKFIYGLANLMTKIPDTVVRVIDVAKMFDKPILDIKLFNEDFSTIFAALANDVETRTETQPLAINIVLGAASIKNALDKVGFEFAQKMFNGILSSHKNIFILIDDYKKFKLLKLEPWFSSVNTSSGLWLGPGIDSQSIIVSNELSEEDRKYNYEGMAYLVKDGTYTLIKTMMDGDD